MEYNFGDTINISALSSELGVSNTPIREALSRLEVEGLVTSTLNSKVQVIDITEDLYKDIDHTFFSIISGCYTTCYLEDKIECLLELMEEAILAQEQALKEKEYMNYAFKAIEFDRCFVAATGNDYLLNTFDTKSPILYLLTRYTHQHPEPNREFNLSESISRFSMRSERTTSWEPRSSSISITTNISNTKKQKNTARRPRPAVFFGFFLRFKANIIGNYL